MGWVSIKDILLLICFILIGIQLITMRLHKKKIAYLNNTKDILYDLREKVIEAVDKEQVYKLILKAAIDMLPKASKGSILMEGKDKLFHYEALIGYSEELKEIKLMKEEVFLYAKNQFKGIAVIKNPARFNENILNFEKHKIFQDTESLDICCTLSCPISINDRVIGVINLDSTEKGAIFSEDDIKYLKYIINELKLVLRVFLMQDDLRYQANYDALTGLYNRRYLEYLLSYHLEMSKNKCKKPTLIFIDLDNFKRINDAYGHKSGDKALVLISNILQKKMNSSSYIYGRMAGDEFIVFIPHGDEKNAIKVIEEVREVYSHETIGDINLDFSYGIIEVTDSSRNLEELIHEADEKMYEVKNYKREKSQRKKSS